MAKEKRRTDGYSPKGGRDYSGQTARMQRQPENGDGVFRLPFVFSDSLRCRRRVWRSHARGLRWVGQRAEPKLCF